MNKIILVLIIVVGMFQVTEARVLMFSTSKTTCTRTVNQSTGSTIEVHEWNDPNELGMMIGSLTKSHKDYSEMIKTMEQIYRDNGFIVDLDSTKNMKPVIRRNTNLELYFVREGGFIILIIFKDSYIFDHFYKMFETVLTDRRFIFYRAI